MKFIRLTNPRGQAIWVNMELVTNFLEIPATSKNARFTMLGHPGGGDNSDWIEVEETPEQILSAMEQSR